MGRLDGERERPAPRLADGDNPDPAECLLRTLASEDLQEKRLYAQIGLEHCGGDAEMRALLLRQLYICQIESHNDAEALQIAEQMIDIGTLADAARQDAARAALALGDIDAAIGHLRIATRICPAKRRSFHFCHLGNLLRYAGRSEEAQDAFEVAKRWATDQRPLYQAICALAGGLPDQGEAMELAQLRENLEDSHELKAYDLWVLGELCLKMGDLKQGVAYLNAFVQRAERGSRAKRLSLRGEIAYARQLLARATA